MICLLALVCRLNSLEHILPFVNSVSQNSIYAVRPFVNIINSDNEINLVLTIFNEGAYLKFKLILHKALNLF